MNTLVELLPEMERLGAREAVLHASGYRVRKWTYHELLLHIRGFAKELEAREIGPGDRLLLWAENRPEWLAAFWAALARGVTLVPLDFRASAAFVSHVQRQVEAKLLVHDTTVDAKTLDVPSLSTESLSDMVSDEPLRTVTVGPDDIVQILYTSGTTGAPKGVVHRHRNLVSNLAPIRDEIRRYLALARPFQPIRLLDLLPLSHVFGQFTGLLVPVALGGAVAFLSEIHPKAIIETIRHERISVLISVPRFLSSLRDELERRFELLDRPTTGSKGLAGGLARWWRYRSVHAAFGWKFWAVLSGGARLPAEDEEFWWRLGFVLVQGYGLTETSSMVTTNHPFHPTRGALGRVVGNQQIRLEDDGEILVRGDNVSFEYFGFAKPSETEWLHTGDIGEIRDGVLYYRGRKKDVIVGADGLNVYPADVEAALDRQPEIKESVVVARPTDRGDAVHAVLILAKGGGDPEAAVQRANAELEGHQRVRTWTLWPDEDFPRTKSTFKIRRGEVAARLEEGRAPEPAEEQTSRARELLGKRLGRSGAELEDTQRLSEELGLTSLDRIELLTELEAQTSREFSESELSKVETVEELERWVARAPSGPSPVPRRNPLDGLPRVARSAPLRFVRTAFRETVTLPLFRHYLPLHVHGDLHAVDGPVVWAPNHQSNLDTLAVLAALPFRLRGRVAPAVQQEYFNAYLESRGARRDRILAALQYWLAITLVNAFPLPRSGAGTRKSLRFAGKIADEGYSILIFPEGRLTRDGRIGSFKPGVGLLAVRLQLPVIPVHLNGLYQIMSFRDRWPKPGPIDVRFGAPLRFHENENFQVAAKRVEDAVRALEKR